MVGGQYSHAQSPPGGLELAHLLFSRQWHKHTLLAYTLLAYTQWLYVAAAAFVLHGNVSADILSDSRDTT